MSLKLARPIFIEIWATSFSILEINPPHIFPSLDSTI